MIAALALARGVDSPALRELAGLGRHADATEILDSYQHALDELGQPVPSVEHAARKRLFECADGLVAGTLTARQAADQCEPAEAWMTEQEFGFGSLAYYGRDFVDFTVPSQAANYEAELTATAQALLDRGGRRVQSSYPCVCCGYLTMSEPPGSYAICPVCFWEDDQVQLRWPDCPGGANTVSLIQAQVKFQAIGASEEHVLKYVRPARDDEPADPEWRQIDPSRDRFERWGEQGTAPWPHDLTVLYWWRHRDPDDGAT